MKVYPLPVHLHDVNNVFKPESTFKQTRVNVFTAKNMTSFLNYVTATLRALFAWRGSNIFSHSLKDWGILFRLHCEMKGHWSRVNLVKHEALLKDLHATSVLSFSNANENKCTSILIFMLKRWKTPKKSEKMSIFQSRDQCLSLENICHSFLMLHCRRMSWKCKY